MKKLVGETLFSIDHFSLLWVSVEFFNSIFCYFNALNVNSPAVACDQKNCPRNPQVL